MIWGLYLLVPFLQRIFKYSKRKEIQFLTITAFVIAIINFIFMSFDGIGGIGGSVLFINWFLLYLPFFLIGYLIRRDNNKEKILLWIIFSLSSLLTLIGYYFVSIQGELTGDAYFHGYSSITVVPMSISAMYLLKSWDTPIFNKQVNKKLSSLSFGIYLIHPIILEILNKTGYIRTVHPAISIPSSTIIIFSVSSIVAWVLYKIPYINKTI